MSLGASETIKFESFTFPIGVNLCYVHKIRKSPHCVRNHTHYENYSKNKLLCMVCGGVKFGGDILLQ